jgi:polyisoprenyl-phosphate glycosyltransferase
MTGKIVSFVIPAFNEATNIVKLHEEICKTMSTERYSYEFIFIDDGSNDDTLQVLKKLCHSHSNVFYVELSRNFGHQNALKCGMDIAAGDCVISMDCDLQHPPEIIHQLFAKWREGFDIVYTCREDNQELPYFKRKTSSYFYSLINKISDLNLEKGVADFRLMDRCAVDAFIRFEESELFIRGLVKWMGFRQTSVSYRPNNRFSGTSKYNLRKMLVFAFKGITSFTTRPLTMAAFIGLFFFLSSLLYVPYIIISYLTGNVVSGWTSLIVTVIFFGGLQLLMLGIIGLYLGKVAIQAKYRPLYFIRNTNYRRIKHESHPGQ